MLDTDRVDGGPSSRAGSTSQTRRSFGLHRGHQSRMGRGYRISPKLRICGAGPLRMGQENDEPNESDLRWNGSEAFSLAPSGDPGDKLRGRQ